MEIDQPVVVSGSRDGEHRFSKVVTDEITLLSGLGVQGKDPRQNNLGFMV